MPGIGIGVEQEEADHLAHQRAEEVEENEARLDARIGERALRFLGQEPVDQTVRGPRTELSTDMRLPLTRGAICAPSRCRMSVPNNR